LTFPESLRLEYRTASGLYVVRLYSTFSGPARCDCANHPSVVQWLVVRVIGTPAKSKVIT